MKLVFEGRKWTAVRASKGCHVIKLPPLFGVGLCHACYAELPVGYSAGWASKAKLGWGPIVTHAPRPS